MMTASELTTCRNLLDMLQDCNGEVADYWGRMLEHIDGQASQIDLLIRKETANIDAIEQLESEKVDLEYAIETRDGQIATLKNIIRKERFFRVWANTKNGSASVNTVAKVATTQLAKEHPDIFKEE